VVSKEQMVNHLYGWGDEVGANAIEVYVYRLRKKLEPLGCEIRTVRGMGYLMDASDAKTEPRLQRKLLAWLLGPLLVLLVLDSRRLLGVAALRQPGLRPGAARDRARDRAARASRGRRARGWSCRRPRPTSC
jgi:hypothetical protein